MFCINGKQTLAVLLDEVLVKELITSFEVVFKSKQTRQMRIFSFLIYTILT
jgi:hypothetical protein